MQFLNRLTARIVKELPDQAILGQWQVLTLSDWVFINTFELTPNSREYLIPDAAYRWLLHTSDGLRRCEKQISPWQFPSDILAESLRFFERELQKLVDNSAPWTDWIKVPPLVPEIEQKINIQPLELKIKHDLVHIEEVCHRPRTYLQLDTERLPVSRAQRISPQASEFLAAHTEDWERRTFRSVLPKRVLCLVREELWNIYENRVTARLIDNLLEYVRRRIAEVETLKQELEEAEYFSGETRDIHWRNRKRIYTLLGNQFEAETGVKKAELTLQQLNQLQYKLCCLIDTKLYKSIPRRASIGTTLKRTNILVNDQHYRYVDLLWREWSRWHGQTKNSRQVFLENQELFRGFESFCLLLVARALSDRGNNNDKGLGFEPVTNLIPQRDGCPIHFQGVLGNLSLHWQEDGSLLLKSDGVKDLRFLPILATITATNNPEAISSILETFSHNLQNSENQTVILYPGTEEERKKIPPVLQRKINTLGNDHLPTESTMAILPVSPLDITSVEKVARAIQWWLLGQRYQSYPFVLSKKIPDALLVDTNWLAKNSKPYQFQVLRQPDQVEEQNFKTRLNQLLHKAKAHHNQGKGELLDLQRLENLPSEAKEIIQPLQVCPVCHSTDSSFKSLDGHCFRSRCSKCDSSWGTRICGSCGKKSPFIQLAGLESQIRQAGWVDRTFGRDIIAIPCWMENNQDTFICSSCGICSKAEQPAFSACSRCQSYRC